MPSEAIRLPILICGVPGVPGFNAYHHFRKRFPGEGQVIAIHPSRNRRLTGEGVVSCDTFDAEALAELWDKHRFGSVLSFAGSCNLKACELDPEMADRVNVLGTRNVAMLAAAHGTRMIHLSSDLVFAGRDGGQYLEDDTPDPVTVYGKTMVIGEQVVQDLHPDSCVLRISLPMGLSANGHAGAIDWIESRFARNLPATLYYDEVRTPTYVGCMNRLYERLLGNRLAGLFHAGAPRQLSLYQIAQVINRVGGYSPDLLKGCPRVDAGPMPPRAGDVTMDSSRLLSELGGEIFQPWPLNADWVPEGQNWHVEPLGGEVGPLQIRATLI
ncbi:dTDP-4-dehydrorhamnose reductase [Roseimaritima multifibrata]|uniref:dTDP-4-dehydrorhamnose reductase n=1 Tax=Roseimaritima multifibrata TaxID=1930274 RepID=A0A517MJF3_9BACT|nr:sugar nucleotide-binding protein [Roseimaritima multifibrata]QDS95022.1 dTDP-4-dehydrorhamnose reductase [Roseimaritima multifibrata]